MFKKFFCIALLLLFIPISANSIEKSNNDTTEIWELPNYLTESTSDDTVKKTKEDLEWELPRNFLEYMALGAIYSLSGLHDMPTIFEIWTRQFDIYLGRFFIYDKKTIDKKILNLTTCRKNLKNEQQERFEKSYLSNKDLEKFSFKLGFISAYILILLLLFAFIKFINNALNGNLPKDMYKNLEKDDSKNSEIEEYNFSSKNNEDKGKSKMYCKNCGKEIDNDSKFCQYCGGKVVDDKPENSNFKNISKKFNAMQIVLFVICAVLAGTLANTTVKSFTSKNFTKKPVINNDLQDAMFLYGFTKVNTDTLELFCKDTGYVPHKYIKSFNSRFYNTILYRDDLLKQFASDSEIIKLRKLTNDALISQLENDFTSTKMQYTNITKKTFCKFYDKYSEKIINQKIDVLNKYKPELFKD